MQVPVPDGGVPARRGESAPETECRATEGGSTAHGTQPMAAVQPETTPRSPRRCRSRVTLASRRLPRQGLRVELDVLDALLGPGAS